MKRRFFQIMALILSLIMCASVSMLPTLAVEGEESTTPEAITPNVAAGTLLLAVNDLSQDTSNSETGATYTHSISDSNADFYSYTDGVMSTNSYGVSATRVYGGMTNLALNESSKYTVSYMSKLSTVGGSGLRISYAAYNNSIGTYLLGTNACLAWGTQTSKGYSGYKSYTDEMKTEGTVFSNNGYAKVDIEINGYICLVYINGKLLVKENITNPSVGTATGIVKSYMSNALSLVWSEYQPNADDTTTAYNTSFKDIKVYSGLLYSEYTEAAADGNILISMEDMSASYTDENSGAKYFAGFGGNKDFYSYNGNGMSTTLGYKRGSNTTQGTRTYGGLTNIPLTATSKYTVSYNISSLGTGVSGVGMRVAYRHNGDSIGLYMQDKKACLAWGTETTNGYSGYKNFTEDMKRNGTVFCNGGYAKVDIEISGNVINVYINNVQLLSEDITAPTNSTLNDTATKQYMSDTLSLVWHEYHGSAVKDGAASVTIKDVKVYSGLLQSEKYIEMLAADVGTENNGKVPVRFSATGSPEWYGLVGFSIIAEYGNNSDRYTYKTADVYRKLTAVDGFCERTADGKYLFAYTLNGVPTDISVKFTVTPYGYEKGTQYFGDSVTYTVENGVLK